MTRTGAALAAFAALPIAASAQTSPEPFFINAPVYKEVMAVPPAAALRADKDGKVVLFCQVDAVGKLNTCQVRSETPVGLGYGAAALRLAPKYVLDRRVRGQESLTSLEFPVNFWLKFEPQEWIRRPDAYELARVLPGGAARRGEDGRATIQCDINAEGTLRGCSVLSESPAGKGFGAAALGLAPSFQLRPPRNRGVFVPGQKVRVPIQWKLDVLPDGETVGTLGNPAWRAAPTRAEVAAAYPGGALAAGRAGFADLFCTLDAEGGLKRCEVLSEQPAAAGSDGRPVSSHPSSAWTPPWGVAASRG